MLLQWHRWLGRLFSRSTSARRSQPLRSRRRTMLGIELLEHRRVPAIIISEVNPTGSGTVTYGADWFEVTNTGASDVNISGWKMDDNSNAFANAVALQGMTIIPAGKSAI